MSPSRATLNIDIVKDGIPLRDKMFSRWALRIEHCRLSVKTSDESDERTGCKAMQREQDAQTEAASGSTSNRSTGKEFANPRIVR